MERIGRAHVVAQGHEVEEPVVVTQQHDGAWWMRTDANWTCHTKQVSVDGRTGEILHTGFNLRAT